MAGRKNGFWADQNRAFAFVVGAGFGIFAGLAHDKTGESAWWLMGIALTFALAGLVVPHWLTPLRLLWMKLAAVLGFINARVFLTIVFAGMVTPIAVLLRLLGKRPIQVAARGEAESYWNRRDPSEFQSSRMERQF
jgi:Saxitoxin biosynthesis operon protein SxtJ